MTSRSPTSWRFVAPLSGFAVNVGLALGLASTPSAAADATDAAVKPAAVKPAAAKSVDATSAAAKPANTKPARKASPYDRASEDAALEDLRERLARTLGATRVTNATTPSVRVVAKANPSPPIRRQTTTQSATKAGAATCR